MEAITLGILTLYGLGILAVVIALIYFIAKRIDDKKREDFEKRDN